MLFGFACEFCGFVACVLLVCYVVLCCLSLMLVRCVLLSIACVLCVVELSFSCECCCVLCR